MKDYTEFYEACRKVVQAAKTAKPGALITYGAAYAKSGLSMTDDEEIGVQCLYILNNLSAWRGPEARETKKVFDKFKKKFK